MKMSGIGRAAAGMALLSCACTGSAPLNAKAAEVERRECTGAQASADELRVRQATTVLKVEPEHYWDLCFGIAKITGTRLLVRGPAGVSSEQLARNLQCASARASLDREDPDGLPKDPYGLPGAWVDVDVAPEGENLAVTLRAESVSNNIRLFHRARAFAASQHSQATQ
jgi:hypothetical protein